MPARSMRNVCVKENSPFKSYAQCMRKYAECVKRPFATPLAIFVLPRFGPSPPGGANNPPEVPPKAPSSPPAALSQFGVGAIKHVLFACFCRHKCLDVMAKTRHNNLSSRWPGGQIPLYFNGFHEFRTSPERAPTGPKGALRRPFSTMQKVTISYV